MDTNEEYKSEYQAKATEIIAANYEMIGSPVQIEAAECIAILWVMVLNDKVGIPIEALDATFQKAWEAKPDRAITIVTMRDMVNAWRGGAESFGEIFSGGDMPIH